MEDVPPVYMIVTVVVCVKSLVRPPVQHVPGVGHVDRGDLAAIITRVANAIKPTMVVRVVVVVM